MFVNGLGFAGLLVAFTATWIAGLVADALHLALADRVAFAIGSGLFSFAASAFAQLTDRFSAASLRATYGRVGIVSTLPFRAPYPVIRRALFAVPLAYFPILFTLIAIVFWAGDAISGQSVFTHGYHFFFVAMNVISSVAATALAFATTRIRYVHPAAA